MNNLGQKIIRFLFLALFLFTPLIMVRSTSEIFELNKMVFIYFITINAFFIWLFFTPKKNLAAFKKSPLFPVMVVYLIGLIITSLISIDSQTSFMGYYDRFNGGLFSIISYLALFLILVSTIDFDYFKSLLKASLFSSGAVILWGLPGKFGHDLTCLVFGGQFNNNCWTAQFRPSERLFSTLGQPNWLGAYLAVNFFIAIYFFLKNDNKSWQQIVLLGYLTLNFIVILFTKSRSALLAVTFGLSLLFLTFVFKLFCSKEKTTLYRRPFRYLLILVSVCLLALFIFKTDVPRVDKYLSFAFIKKTKPAPKIAKAPSSQSQYGQSVTASSTIREIVWQGAIDIFKHHPLLGTGLETFGYAYYQYRPQAHNLTSEWDYLYNRAHNEYLNYLATTGLVGSLPYFAYIFLILYLFSRKILFFKSEKRLFILYLSLLIAFLTILITNFFGFSTTTINLYFYLLPAAIFIPQKGRQSALAGFSPRKNKIYLIGGLIGVLILNFWLLNFYQADLAYARATNELRAKNYPMAVKELFKAEELSPRGVYENKLSSTLANLAFLVGYQKDKKLAAKFIKLSQSYNDKTLTNAPKNILYWKTRVKNNYVYYQTTAQEDYLKKGVADLQEAIQLAPTDPKLPYTEALFYSLLNDVEKDKKMKLKYQALSLQAVEKSIRLKPNFQDGHTLKKELRKKYNR